MGKADQVTAKNHKKKLRDHFNAGLDYAKDEQTDKAIKEFLIAYEEAKILGDDKKRIACAFNLAAAHLEQKCVDAAEKYLEEVEKFEKELKGGTFIDEKDRGDLCFNWATFYEKRDHPDPWKAIECYWKACECYKSDRNKYAEHIKECLEKLCVLQEIVQTYDAAYSSYVELEKFEEDEARRCRILLKQAQMLHRYNPNQPLPGGLTDRCASMAKGQIFENSASILNDLGLLYMERMDYEQALEFFAAAKRFTSAHMQDDSLMGNGSNADPLLAGFIRQNLGAVFNCRMEYRKALQYHKDALCIFNRLQTVQKHQEDNGHPIKSLKKEIYDCRMNYAAALAQESMEGAKEARKIFREIKKEAEDNNDELTKKQAEDGIEATRQLKNRTSFQQPEIRIQTEALVTGPSMQTGDNKHEEQGGSGETVDETTYLEDSDTSSVDWPEDYDWEVPKEDTSGKKHITQSKVCLIL